MELLEAVKKVLEWYAEDASDNVARRAVMHDLKEAYENASQPRVQSDGFTAEQIAQIRRIARDVAFEGGD